MEFIAEDPVYVAVGRPVPAIYDVKGRLITPEKRHTYAQFKRGVAAMYAREVALKTFGYNSRPEDMDPGQYVASYDSVEDQRARGWTDEEREDIEKRLVELGHVVVERPRVAAPYPMYDKHRKVAGRRTVEHAIADITAAHESAGFDVEQAVAYERENGNDPAVIEALQALVQVEPEAEDDPLIAA